MPKQSWRVKDLHKAGTVRGVTSTSKRVGKEVCCLVKEIKGELTDSVPSSSVSGKRTMLLPLYGGLFLHRSTV